MNMNPRGFRRANFATNRDTPLTDEQIRAVAPSIFAREAHESRSPRFSYIPTDAVLAGLRNEGFLPYSVCQGGTRIEGKAEYTKHMIRLRHGDAPKALNEAVHEIVLVNAHDGTASYQLLSGVMRLICLNGMMVGETFNAIRVRHTGDAVGQVIEGAYEVLEDGPRVIAQIEDWRATQLSPGERQAFAEAAHELRFAEAKHSPAADQLLGIRRTDDRGTDLWRTINVVQENLMRGGIRYMRSSQRTEDGRYLRPRQARTRDVTSIDGQKGLNRALWTLAEKMRELKQAA